MKSFTRFIRLVNTEEKCIDFLLEKGAFRNTIKQDFSNYGKRTTGGLPGGTRMLFE